MTATPEVPESRFGVRRVLAAIGSSLLIVYAVFWSLKFLDDRLTLWVVWPMAWIGVAAYLCWFALRGNDSDSRRWMAAGLRTGALVGAVGFVLGFVGPLIFMPRSNQGPLLGIFITGPVGAVLGVLLGLVLFPIKRRATVRKLMTPS